MPLPPPWRSVCAEELRRNRKKRSLAIFVIAVVSLTGVLGQHFYNQPKLDVGTIAPQTIKAPFTAGVEDTKSTQDNRKAAIKGFVPVLMLDFAVNKQIDQDLQKVLALGNELRQIAGSFPWTSTSILSTSTQLYLRECPELEWQAVLAAVDTTKHEKNVSRQEKESNHPTATGRLNYTLPQVVAQLQAYRLKTSPQNFSTLIATGSQVRQRYSQALSKLSTLPEVLKAQTVYKPSLLELSDADWRSTEIGIRNSTQRILAQGIPPGLPPKILQSAVSLQVKTLVPTAAENMATQMLLSVLQPNLKEDVEQTRLQVQQAAAAVQPVMLQVAKGQVIVRAGEVITPREFLELDYFHLSRREINWLGLIQLGGIVIAAIGVFGLVEQRYHSKSRQRDRLLVLLLSLSAPLLVRVGVPYTNFPAIGLLLGSFYGSPLGVTVVGLMTLLLQSSRLVHWEYLLAGAAGGLLGSWMAGRLRSREELALLGGAVGLTQGFVYLMVNIILGGTFSGLLWYVGVREAVLVGLSGLAWSIIALGLSPYLEHLFDLVTPIRLAELANPNRPLLKRLAAEAPGTFQHTMFVATLAEAAAKALDCNVELVRAGTLYHDIGKMHDPMAFIENQMSGPNKHDELNNPWKSAEIIKKHVREGLVMARKHRLPTAIKAFIPEHQGTMSIAYFYHQAQQLAAKEPNGAGVTEPVLESDFRYDGPIPQSRESGIVMLADSCEAALRSLKDASPEQALAMLKNILRARWQDNQLVDSGLTRDEMTQIAEIFVEVWQQFNHKRIAYPKKL
jgi:putative nucleotidyltransferase with HDIG domain